MLMTSLSYESAKMGNFCDFYLLSRVNNKEGEGVLLPIPLCNSCCKSSCDLLPYLYSSKRSQTLTTAVTQV